MFKGGKSVFDINSNLLDGENVIKTKLEAISCAENLKSTRKPNCVVRFYELSIYNCINSYG